MTPAFRASLVELITRTSTDLPPDVRAAMRQAGYGEHGREGLQELLDVPVVDITEAAASTAMYLGHRYSVVTTLDRTVPLIEDRLKLAGLSDRCASVRASGLAVLELEEDPAGAVEAIVRQAELAVSEDKAEVIVLGCGGMAGGGGEQPGLVPLRGAQQGPGAAEARPRPDRLDRHPPGGQRHRFCPQQ